MYMQGSGVKFYTLSNIYEVQNDITDYYMFL